MGTPIINGETPANRKYKVVMFALTILAFMSTFDFVLRLMGKDIILGGMQAVAYVNLVLGLYYTSNVLVKKIAGGASDGGSGNGGET